MWRSDFADLSFRPIRFKSAKVTDKRVRIMNEIISGIRVIKMYAWENAFKKLITKLRRCVSDGVSECVCTAVCLI